MASAVVTIGGKGSSLSPTSVYSISHGLSKVKIDSSALEKLSQTQSKKPSLVCSPDISSSNPRFLTREESRAALIVLLNKLVLSASNIRPNFPILIGGTLNLGCGHETLDFGSSLGFLDSLCRLNSKNLNEFGVTSEEIGVIENSLAALVGICAVLDCCSSALLRLSDAVAALSCEAARVDGKIVFDLPVSDDGFSIMDEIDVAGDMKVLLSESKLAGKIDSGSFVEIPTVHGSFRDAVRSLHSRVRVELNSIVDVQKTIGAWGSRKEKAFVASVLPLAMSIQSMSESSFGRARTAIMSIDDQEQAKVVEAFEKGCPNLDRLRESFLLITEKASSGSDCFEVLHFVYDLLAKFREILAWEAAVALFVLEMDELTEKPQVGHPVSIKENGENLNGDRKSEKKKKKTLVRGTSVIRQLLKDRFMGKNEASIDNVAVLVEWVQGFLLYFDPKDGELDSLLNKLNEIFESNDNKRLPEIPKLQSVGYMMPQVHNVEETQEKGKVKWDENMLGTFLKICVAEVNAGHRPTTHFTRLGWKIIVTKFNQATGRSFDRKQLKNKWDNLKREWQIWCKLVGNETGLGWDPQKKTVQASDGWWEKKLKEVPDAKKFKERGLLFPEEMGICFRDVVATGDSPWVPSYGILPLSCRVEEIGSGWDDVDLDEGHSDSVEAGGESTTREERRENGLDDVALTGDKEKKRQKTSSSNGKGKKGSASKINGQYDHICGETESNNIMSVMEVMSIIRKFPGFAPNTDLFYIATRLMLKKSHREMFMALEEPSHQLAWLQSYSKDDL